MRVAVVGAGPAGVRAVERLVAAGLRPTWVEESPDGGGRIYQRPPPGFRRDHAALYGDDAGKARALHATLDALKPRCDWRPETLVWNIRRDALETMRAGTAATIGFDAAVLCTGAMDRVVPLPGWTMPGVTTLGGAQIALKAQGVGIGRRVVFCGTGPLLLLVATQYAKAGAEVVAVLDTTPFATKLRAVPGLLGNAGTFLRGLRLRAGLRVAEGVTPLDIEGDAAVQGFRWRDARGRDHRVDCDAVALGWGLKPEGQLADLAGIPFRFDATQSNWVPETDGTGRTSIPGLYLAGDGAGIGGADVAELAGARAALAVLADAGHTVDAAALDRRLTREARFRAALERAFPWPAALAAAMADDTILCRCEAVTAGEVRSLAAAEINRTKSYSRLGMGRCQGRVCGPAGAAVLARVLGCSLEEAGRLRGQMPVKPIPLPVAATP